MEFIDVEGQTIHYKFTDNNKGRAIVFINSLGTDFRIWDEVASGLADVGNTLQFDKRGHGLSDIAENTNGLSDFTDDAIGLIDSLKIEKLIVVGLSVGGMIAQVLASRISEKIERLILCDTRHKIGTPEVWNDRIHTVKQNGLPAISAGVMDRWFSKAFQEKFPNKLAGCKNMLERTPVKGYVATCEAIRDGDLTSIASAITLPTMCVVGTEDKSTPVAEVKALADLIKGSRFEVIAGSAWRDG